MVPITPARRRREVHIRRCAVINQRMLRNQPHLCSEHKLKLTTIERSHSHDRALLLGGLLLEGKRCDKCNPPRVGGRGWIGHPPNDTPSLSDHNASDCAACLLEDWLLKFAKEEGGLRRSSPEEYIGDGARLKATFPGYPRETTPRVECYSTEEFLLKEGRRFSVEPLASEETSLLREAHEALKRAAGGGIPAGESWSEDGWATV